ncbi:hypothetical protein GQX74_002966 [Glossina fuscipes]|nr:hypothetical protein GQX74_002966 [Glossina fuscipes]
MCAFCPFVQAVSVNVSVFTLTAIAVDRHRAIINPLRARRTKFASKLVIISIWVAALTFALPCAIAFRVEMLNERVKGEEYAFFYLLFLLRSLNTFAYTNVILLSICRG